MFQIERDYHFESARSLPNLPEGHPCRRIHGHSFGVTVRIAGTLNEQMGWLLDYAEIDEVVAPIVAELDHRLLNDVLGLENPTSELLCVWIYERLQSKLPGLVEIVISEENSARCSYRPQ